MKSRAGIVAVWAFAMWALAGFALGVAAVAFGSPSINGVPDPPWTAFLFFPAASAFPIVGALIATRQPRNAVGWILLAFGLMGAIQVPAALYADHHFAHHEGPLPGDEVAAWLSDWLGQTVLFAVVLFLPQLFPTGRPLTRRWRPCSGSSAIVLDGATVGRMLMDAKLGSDPWIVDNPFGVLPIGVYDAFNVSGAFVLPFSFARAGRALPALPRRRAAAAQVARLRRGGDGVLLRRSPGRRIVLVHALGRLLGDGHPRLHRPADRHGHRDPALPARTRSTSSSSRTLLYGALTACVVGAYVAVIALAGALLREQVGIGAAVVATGLVAVMFDPLRTRLQRAVNHLLYGERDDPATAVARLAQRLEVDGGARGRAARRRRDGRAGAAPPVRRDRGASRTGGSSASPRTGSSPARRSRSRLRTTGPRWGSSCSACARGKTGSRRETAACWPISPSTRARPCTPCGSRPTCSAPASASWPRARRSAARSGATSTTASARRWQASPCRSIWRVPAWAWTTLRRSRWSRSCGPRRSRPSTTSAA